MNSLNLNKYAYILIGIFIVMLVWWGYIFSTQLIDTNHNFLYGGMLGVLPVVAAFFGFKNSKEWGLLESSMGKAVFFLSLGLLTWGTGTIIFAYYNIFLQVAVPYPSLADAFYIVSWPLWIVSMYNLSKATGVKFQLKDILGRSLMFIIPIITIIISYYVLIVVARQGFISDYTSGLKTFFDLAYPIGDVFILTASLLIYGLSFKYLGGFFKWPIIIILGGFVANYVADFSFVYSVTKETYFVANWIDLIYTTAFFLLSLGVSVMDTTLLSKKVEDNNVQV